MYTEHGLATLAAPIASYPYEYQIGMRFIQNLSNNQLNDEGAEAWFFKAIVNGDYTPLSQYLKFLPYQVDELKVIIKTHRVPGGWIWDYTQIWGLASFWRAERDAILSGRYPNPYTTQPDPILKAQWEAQVNYYQNEINKAVAANDTALVNANLKKWNELMWQTPAGIVPRGRVPAIASVTQATDPSKLHKFMEIYGKVFTAIWTVGASIATLGVAKELVSKYISSSDMAKDMVDQTNKAREELGMDPLKEGYVDDKVSKLVADVANKEIADMTNQALMETAISQAAAQQAADENKQKEDAARAEAEAQAGSEAEASAADKALRDQEAVRTDSALAPTLPLVKAGLGPAVPLIGAAVLLGFVLISPTRKVRR